MPTLGARIWCEHKLVINTDFIWISQGFIEDAIVWARCGYFDLKMNALIVAFNFVNYTQADSACNPQDALPLNDSYYFWDSFDESISNINEDSYDDLAGVRFDYPFSHRRYEIHTFWASNLFQLCKWYL